MRPPILLIACLLAGCQATEAPAPPELEAVALPADLDALDPPVRDQLRELHADVERRSANLAEIAVKGAADVRGGANARLGQAFGELGQALAAYHYWQPARAAFANARQLAAEPRWSYYLGMAQRRLGRLEESVAAFEEFLAEHPGDVPALVWLGENQLGLGRLDQARNSFQRAAEADADCVRALFGLGRVALEGGDAETAARHLEAAAAGQPASSRIRYSLAMAHRARGDVERAEELFAAVESDHVTEPPIALDDPLMSAIRELQRGAMTHERRGLRAAARGQLKLAALELQQAVALDPDRFDAWHNLGLALLRLGRQQDGERELHRLVQRHPRHAPTWVLLGNVAAEGGDAAEAERCFRTAIDADPHLARAHQSLAELLRASGRLAEAREHAARAEELEPEAGGAP